MSTTQSEEITSFIIFFLQKKIAYKVMQKSKKFPQSLIPALKAITEQLLSKNSASFGVLELLQVSQKMCVCLSEARPAPPILLFTLNSLDFNHVQTLVVVKKAVHRWQLEMVGNYCHQSYHSNRSSQHSIETILFTTYFLI